jgi:glutamate-1-semialdehyde 2,1-aminomutase
MAVTHEPAAELAEAFAERFPRSLAEYQRAASIFPAGITHDSRHSAPYPIYVDHAQGARKWTIEGVELIDYWMGHGALLLGHNNPAVVEAVQAQLARGTHYGASHQLEAAWGELVIRLIPSAERVRFTSSGTEATLMALRLARAATGRSKVIKFQGHFHGWHDYLAVGITPPFDAPNSAGIPAEVLSTVLLAPPNSLRAVRDLLDAHDDVAAVILEPGGGSNGLIAPDLEFLHGLRALTAKRGVVLIFDEVITGFRYARGGAQERYGITPDLTTLAKILAGGLPGGAVAGKAAILDYLDYHDGDAQWNRHGRVAQQGTFNGNPLSAAAGIACLTQVAAGEMNRAAWTRSWRGATCPAGWAAKARSSTSFLPSLACAAPAPPPTCSASRAALSPRRCARPCCSKAWTSCTPARSSPPPTPPPTSPPPSTPSTAPSPACSTPACSRAEQRL